MSFQRCASTCFGQCFSGFWRLPQCRGPALLCLELLEMVQSSTTYWSDAQIHIIFPQPLFYDKKISEWFCL